MRFYLTTALLLATSFFTLSLTNNSAIAQRPNIILLNLDDADTDLLTEETASQHFPAIAELYKSSTVFSNAHATTPFCAPSRAALFSGKYGFNNGCKTGSESAASSVGFEGGYQRFKALGHDQNELGVWMKQAGYRTMHVGKFHHDGFDFEVPAGWDDFSLSAGARYYGGTRFSNINQSPPLRYRTGDEDYVSVEDRNEVMLALDIQDEQRPDQPYFLYLAPIAPHFPATPDLSVMAEQKYRTYAEGLLQPTDDPDFDEADLSDKPAHLQRPPLNASEKAHLQDAFIYRLRAMKSIDDTIAALVDRLKQNGQWDNTYLLITSDNGYSLGHHRTLYKKDPYQRSSRLPLLVASPESRTAQTASHLIAHLDICPTILQLAGATIPSDLDGKSFAPLLDGTALPTPDTWQRSIMIENWADKYVKGEQVPMSYTAERFYDKVHIAWSTGDHEFYYLESDPFQLDNVYATFNQTQKDNLNDSLLSFRKKDVDPGITLTSPISGTRTGNVIPFAGYMEDNSVPVMARLVVQSFTTKRYFNGRTWQDSLAAIPVAPSTTTSSINSWKEDLSIFSETRNDYDIFVSWVVPVDDTGNTGELKFTVNAMLANSIYAAINPQIDGKTYTGRTQRIVGYHGRFADQRVNFAIIDKQTNMFFNGTSLQNAYFAFTADSLPNRRWSKDLQLPPGDYRCYANAFAKSLYQSQHSIADFSVQ